MWNKPAKEILAKALASDGAAKDEAERTIDNLGRMGFMEFGELLNVEEQ